MNRPTHLLLALALAFASHAACAQAYEFRQGYVFEQRYVKRIAISQAEQLAKQPGLFEPLRTFEWTQAKEKIADARVKRAGPRLVFELGGKAQLSLKDYATKQGDGERQTFKYLKTVAGYHVVGVEYGHDQPQFMLVPEAGGQIYFVDSN